MKKWEFNKVTSYTISAKRGCLKSLEYFHKEAKVDFTSLDSSGQNAIFYAVVGGSIPCAEYLVKRVKLNYKICNRLNGNSLVRQTGIVDIVKWCCEVLKLDPHRYNFSGQNCLRLAVEAENLQSVKYLYMKMGFNPYAADNYG